MSKARGFTLIEVLVALVLLSLFAVVAYRALDAVLISQQHAIGKMERLNRLATAFALMDRDLANTATRFDPAVPGAGGFQALLEQDGASRFYLLRLLPDDADQGLQRIGYRCAGETLSRLVWPDVNDPVAAPKEFVLLDGLRACAFRYLGAGQQWFAAWQDPTGGQLPRAVELTVGEVDGTSIRRVLALQ